MQQILMVVLAVIIVGVAVTVGITMFGSNAYNSNRSAMSAELQALGALLLQYWKMPPMMGGAGMNASNVSLGSVSAAIGFSAANPTSPHHLLSENGEYRIKSVNGNVVVLAGLGKEVRDDKRPYLETTVDMETGTINTVVLAAADFQ